MNWLLVFIGGGAGSLVRYGIARGMMLYNLQFTWATMVANGLSCILLGALMGISMREGLDKSWNLLLMVGFCGGFSTFSTFTAETFGFIEKGDWSMALTNVLLSVLICLLGIFVGIKAVT